MSKVNLAAALDNITKHWQPEIAGTVNDMHIKLVKLKDEFVWHHHDTEDEMFLVIKGQLTMKFRDRDEILEEGEFIIIPHGVEHCPLAEGECDVMLLEPKSTLNTGNVVNERTVKNLNNIA